jgi:hypothetical protein
MWHRASPHNVVRVDVKSTLDDLKYIRDETFVALMLTSVLGERVLTTPT